MDLYFNKLYTLFSKEYNFYFSILLDLVGPIYSFEKSFLL